MTGLDNFTGTRPSLVAEDVERLLRAMEARRPGTDRGTQGIADAFGVAVKTLYRYWPGRVEWTDVGGYRIPFLVRPDRVPVVLPSRDLAPASLSDKLR